MLRVVALAVVLVLGAGSAAAQEGDWSGPSTLFPLNALTVQAEAKTAALYARGLDPGADREALREIDQAGLTVFIGTLWYEAERTLLASLSWEAMVVVQSLPLDADAVTIAELIRGTELEPLEAWLAQGLAPDWLRFATALDSLRRAARGIGPERVCPVLGTNWFINNWGDARPGDRSHKGIDMTGKRGIPVQAIEDGVVLQANWHRQGGRQIYIRADSTGDVYYYAHLDYWEKWIWTGTRVEAGDVIGRLGSSGNADSPHLHFGWMPGSRRVDLNNLQNPYPLLVEICPDNEVPLSFLRQLDD